MRIPLCDAALVSRAAHTLAWPQERRATAGGAPKKAACSPGHAAPSTAMKPSAHASAMMMIMIGDAIFLPPPAQNFETVCSNGWYASSFGRRANRMLS